MTDPGVGPLSRRDALARRSGGSLTSREREVLALIASGLDNGAIADRLCVSRNTVEHHITAVYAKLRVSSRAQAIVQAYRLGLTGSE